MNEKHYYCLQQWVEQKTLFSKVVVKRIEKLFTSKKLSQITNAIFKSFVLCINKYLEKFSSCQGNSNNSQTQFNII